MDQQRRQHGKWSRFIEWFGVGHGLHAIIQSELIRTVVIPTVMTLATGTAGVLGGIPIMWIIMASCVVFASVSAGFLTTAAYRDRKTAENKLRFNGTIFNFDLVPVSLPNRKQRRATSSAVRREARDELQPIVRELASVQLGAEFWNTAMFPISVILEDAESEFEGETPPRTKFPKEPSPVLPGVPIRICDTKIDLNDSVECGKLEGKLRLRIKYGKPGEERYTMELKMRRVDIAMELNGFYRGNQTEWEELA